jgi:hypothetical protein
MAATLNIGTNSYIDISYADNYFSERLFVEQWDNAEDDTKIKAILMATNKIERQQLRGIKVDVDQVMQFPRSIYSYEPKYSGVVGVNYNVQPNIRRISYGPGWYPQLEVPEEVKKAVCEETLALLTIGNSKRIQLQKQGVTQFSVTGISESYSSNTKKLLSNEAIELLKPYLGGSVVIT